jgi:hypothetical protein
MFSRPEMGATHAENPPDIHTNQNPPIASNSAEYTRAPETVYTSKVRIYVELLVFLLYSERPSVTRMKTLSLYYHYFITTYKLTFYS